VYSEAGCRFLYTILKPENNRPKTSEKRAQQQLTKNKQNTAYRNINKKEAQFFYLAC